MHPLKTLAKKLVLNKIPMDINQPVKDSTIYTIEINALNGNPIHLDKFKGKKLLFVNVASKCGYTKQYGPLQKLQDAFGDKLVIIGCPCNQFGSQEPGNAEQIKDFCERNYGVNFLMTEKLEVKGDQQHPLYQWLTKKDKNGNKSSNVKWNFQKYLLDEKGQLLEMFESSIDPLSSKITDFLK
ncbi:glutathione peroxidase [Sediminicola arcticus]|jgi:glutathione peroxidase|uniref:glutathione peroxidase n=1 Tax=Sediminicola arcticus TaxID=1574308 RepID=UPI003AD1ED95